MIRIVLFVLFFGVANVTKAQSNPEFKNIDRLSVNAFKLLDGSELTILTDTVEMMSKIEINGELQKNRLKFVIPLDLTTKAYNFLTKFVEVIVLESNIWEAAGLSANIVNLTFLLIQNGHIVGAEFSNSFFTGVDSIRIIDGSISLSVLRFVKYSADNNPICCVFDFVMNDSFRFERKEGVLCREYGSNKTLPKQECICDALAVPLVFDVY